MTPLWKHNKLVPLATNDMNTMPTDKHVAESDRETNKSDCDQSDSAESDGDIIDTEGADMVGGLTFSECIKAQVVLLWDFGDGLKYQLQFGDSRMLDCLKREGCLRAV